MLFWINQVKIEFFLFRDSVPNELIQVNPLGLAITYFREDEAFK